jgi:uncharacterized protein (TIGR02231 family)
MRLMTAVLVLVAMFADYTAFAQEAMESTRIEVTSQPTTVTAYRGRAWVERTVTQAMQPGLYKVVFSDLPPRWQNDSTQARVSGPAKVLGIDMMSRQVTAPPSNLSQLVDAVKASKVAVQMAKDAVVVTDASIEFIQSMMSRAAEVDREKSGTAELDIAALEQQMEFFSGQMRTLLNAKLGEAGAVQDRQRELEVAESRLRKAGGATRTQREAVVEVAVTGEGEVSMTLGYLVSNANWTPRYDIRGDLDDGTVAVEYGAEVTQQSGEDWTDVTLVLSTAQPSQDANPPTLRPSYVDVYVPPPPAPAAVSGRSRGGGSGGVRSMKDGAIAEGSAEYYAMDAQIQSSGPSVTFTLPRRMTVETDSKSAQRTRIAEFNADVDFTYVAMPVLTEQIFLRGRFANDSAFQLLPGQAGVFMGGDYVGPTMLGSTAPGSKIELFFGADAAMEATRTMLAKRTADTGLFSDWLKTSYQFVLKVDNGSSRPVPLELWDRRPISRSDEIEVSVLNLSAALSTDAGYVADSLPMGLLRWDITVPAHRTGEDAFVVSYDLDVERKNGVKMTPLPD